MFNALTNVARAHWSHDGDHAGVKTDTTAEQASSEPADAQTRTLDTIEETIRRTQGEDAARNFRAGKAHYVAEAARIAHLPADERAVFDRAGQVGLDGFRTGKARAELEAKEMAKLPPDEQYVLRYHGDLAWKGYKDGKARAALKQDERAVFDAAGQQALNGLQQGKCYATLPKDQQAVLHGAGEQALNGFRTGMEVARLGANARAVYEWRGEQGLKDFHAGEARASLSKGEHAILDVAGEDGLNGFKAGEANAMLTDHDRALIQANRELQNEALIRETLKGHTILAGDNLSALHITDKVTDHLLPGKAMFKAAVAGNFEDAMVLGPLAGSPELKLGLWEAGKDMAGGIVEQGKTATLGPLYGAYQRVRSLAEGDVGGAAPEVSGAVEAPLAIRKGLQKIADGDIRGGVRVAAPAVLTLVSMLEPLVMHPMAPRTPTPPPGARGAIAKSGAEAAELEAGARTAKSSEGAPSHPSAQGAARDGFDPRAQSGGGPRIAQPPRASDTIAQIGGIPRDLIDLQKQWPSLSLEQRLAHVRQSVNGQLQKFGIPELEVIARFDQGDPIDGLYNVRQHEIAISERLLRQPELSPADVIELSKTLRHEIEHSAQWVDMARVLAAHGASVEQIVSMMGRGGNIQVSERVARWAVAEQAGGRGIDLASPRAAAAVQHLGSVYNSARNAQGMTRKQVFAELDKANAARAAAKSAYRRAQGSPGEAAAKVRLKRAKAAYNEAHARYVALSEEHGAHVAGHLAGKETEILTDPREPGVDDFENQPTGVHQRR